MNLFPAMGAAILPWRPATSKTRTCPALTVTHRALGADHDLAQLGAGSACRTRTCDECPDYLACTNGACVIPNCSADSDCPGGYCVQGACAGSLGTCTPLCF
jgi:hypothetical protein